jgi:hypothetical protein
MDIPVFTPGLLRLILTLNALLAQVLLASKEEKCRWLGRRRRRLGSKC